MSFIKNIISFGKLDFFPFILLYKYLFFAYIFNVALTFYSSKHLLFYERFCLVFKNVLLMSSIQMIKLLARSL